MHLMLTVERAPSQRVKANAEGRAVCCDPAKERDAVRSVFKWIPRPSILVRNRESKVRRERCRSEGISRSMLEFVRTISQPVTGDHRNGRAQSSDPHFGFGSCDLCSFDCMYRPS